jgi:alpha-tubulin suppressor-like RCC1 family protein
MHPIRLAVFIATVGVILNVVFAVTRDPGLVQDPARFEAAMGQGFVDIAVGSTHTCAVGAMGGVWCWGEGGSGQLGHGSFQDSATPVPVVGLPEAAVSVAVGGSTSCAAGESGSLHCWGSSASGQIGLPESTPAIAVAHRIQGLGHVHSVAVGTSALCAAQTNGQTACWGELRVPHGNRIYLETHLTPTTLPDAPFLVDLVAGDSHICGTTLDHSTWCWGGADMGAMGEMGGKPLKAVLEPNAVPLDPPARLVAAGGAHNCAVDTAGDLLCWGKGEAFRADLLGGETGTNSVPMRVGKADNALALVAGNDAVCLLLPPGQVGCIGSDADSIWMPFDGTVPALVHLDAGGDRLCGLDPAGWAWCAPLTGATAVPDMPASPAKWVPDNSASARWNRLVGIWARKAVASAEAP